MSRDLDASVRAFKLQGVELAAIGDAYRRRTAWSHVERLSLLESGCVAALDYRTITIWDVEEDREVERITAPHAPKAVSPDGSRYVLQVASIEGATWTDHAAWLWSPEHGCLRVLDDCFEIATGFFPDGSFAATSRGVVFRFDRDGNRTHRWETPGSYRARVRPWFLAPFVCCADGRIFAIGHAVGAPPLLFSWSASGEFQERRLENGFSSTLSRFRDQILIPRGDGVHRFDPATLGPLGTYALPGALHRPGVIASDDRGFAVPAGGGVAFVSPDAGSSCIGPEPPYSLSAMVFTGDGARMIGAGIGGEIRIWDRGTGAEIAPLERHERIACLAARPNGELVVGRSGSGSESSPPRFTSFVDVLDPETLARAARIDCGIAGGVEGVAIAPDGTLAAIAAEGGITITKPDGETFTLPATGRGAGILWRPNGELVTLTLDAFVCWDAAAKQELRRIPRRFGTITTPLFEHSWETETSEHPERLLACSRDGSLGITTVFGDELTETSWLRDGITLEPLASGKRASAAAIAPDASWAAVAFGREIAFVAPAESTPRASMLVETEVQALAISPDGRHWALATFGGRIEVRVGAAEAAAGFADLSGAQDRARALVFLADGSLVAGTDRGNVIRFDLKTASGM